MHAGWKSKIFSYCFDVISGSKLVGRDDTSSSSTRRAHRFSRLGMLHPINSRPTSLVCLLARALKTLTKHNSSNILSLRNKILLADTNVQNSAAFLTTFCHQRVARELESNSCIFCLKLLQLVVHYDISDIRDSRPCDINSKPFVGYQSCLACHIVI